MVTTIYGEMHSSLLEKREGTDENDNEIVKWVEYWLDEEMVHRSVHLHLKQNIMADIFAAEIG